MKIAFSTPGESLDAPLDGRFGRTARFLVYDDEAGTIDVIENRANLDAPQGAGIQAATRLADAGVDVVITGHCGPKAFQVLRAAGIRVYLTDAPTIDKAYALFKEGKLRPAEGPDTPAHWS